MPTVVDVDRGGPPGVPGGRRSCCSPCSCWILLAASASVLRARQRQRELLSLLAHGDPKVPGALVVDHPAAAAYCLPGLRSAIVISAGTLDLLDADELAAVLAHERAHLRERHDLVLLPFLALLRAFRWAGIARQAYRAVGLLVEMHADDRALQAAAGQGAGDRAAARRCGRRRRRSVWRTRRGQPRRGVRGRRQGRSGCCGQLLA